jgi:hypothetical protein
MRNSVYSLGQSPNLCVLSLKNVCAYTVVGYQLVFLNNKMGGPVIINSVVLNSANECAAIAVGKNCAQ